MSAPCPRAGDVRRLVAARLADTISTADSRDLKSHCAACRPCGTEAVRLDPTLLFATLSAAVAASDERSRRVDEAEASEARRLSADVLAAIEVERTDRMLRRSGASPRRVVLRAASVALLAGALLGLVHLARRAPQPQAVAVRPPAAAPRSERPATTPLLIDDLQNRGATVYQFAASSEGEPNVVFVVDRNADI